jgi:raffinose/stachyose/melibiose transport system permease protein
MKEGRANILTGQNRLFRIPSSVIIVYVLLVSGILMIILPLYMTIITAIKTNAENTASFFAWPGSLYLDNFHKVLNDPRLFRSFINTVYITAGVLAGNIMIQPCLGYAISRSMGASRLYRLIYYFCLMGIFIPFEVKMIPLVKLASWLNMLNPSGLIIVYISSSVCESVFLYTGFLHSIPGEMEEAAYIDGASAFNTYTRIVFTLLKPMLATVLIRNGLWVWNDFMLPLILLNRSDAYWTITLFTFSFKTEFTTDYSTMFACFTLSMVPVLAFYVFMQKHIIGGLTGGALKG